MGRGEEMEINTVNIVSSGDYYDVSNMKSENKVVSQEIKRDNINNKKEKQVSTVELNSAVDKANKVLFKNNSHLQFRIHEKTNEVMVKIIDDETGDVLKEIPPEKMLDFVAKLWEIAGILVDKKV